MRPIALRSYTIARTSLSASARRPFTLTHCLMAERSNLSHEERTAVEPRGAAIHAVDIERIEQVNDIIRVIQLAIRDKENGVKFLPGQWLDVFVPGIAKAGGFTLTSTPREASLARLGDSAQHPYLELAIQKSPDNPPAAWLWRPEEDILRQTLNVRVGGSFVWPPAGVSLGCLKTIVLVAGGVGINPLISICAHIIEQDEPVTIHLLYSTRAPTPCKSRDNVLFLSRILDLQKHASSASKSKLDLQLFVTGESVIAGTGVLPDESIYRRMSDEDVLAAIGNPAKRASTVCYVCGPPVLTDHCVDLLRRQESMEPDRVLCEKWW